MAPFQTDPSAPLDPNNPIVTPSVGGEIPAAGSSNLSDPTRPGVSSSRVPGPTSNASVPVAGGPALGKTTQDTGLQDAQLSQVDQVRTAAPGRTWSGADGAAEKK